jgi:pyruvyltransferase
MLYLAQYTDEPNIGDSFFSELLSQLKVKHKTINCMIPSKKKKLLGPGSILKFADSKTFVYGSGFISNQENLVEKPLNILGVRGHLSASKIETKFKIPVNVISDPGLLISKFYRRKTIRTNRIYIPHFNEDPEMTLMNSKILNANILRPTGNLNNFIKTLSESSLVFSKSLHGLVFADSLQIPRVWLEPNSNMLGGTFKFYDYFSSIGRFKASLVIEDFNKNNELDYVFSMNSVRLKELVSCLEEKLILALDNISYQKFLRYRIKKLT